MTQPRGRGRPPGSGKNQRAAMDPALRAAIAEQDQGEGEKENAFVLSNFCCKCVFEAIWINYFTVKFRLFQVIRLIRTQKIELYFSHLDI